MPVRDTKRGVERTPIEGHFDAIVCGASFAGLATARELRGSDARLLLLDRYQIGERQTSACAAPSAWLERLGLGATIAQRFDTLVLHLPNGTVRIPIPFSFCTFDYRAACDLLAAQGEFAFETATVTGPAEEDGECVRVSTDRGSVTAPLVVDALGWRRILGHTPYQPPGAPLSRGLEVHPPGDDSDFQIWIDRSLVPAGYGWFFPAGDEVRIGVGSFDPARHVREPALDLVERTGRRPEGFQGNYIPHRLRDATEGSVFFVGDSAGQCIPLSAEGIRTALYFGIAAGRELRAVHEGRKSRSRALADYQAFAGRHERAYRIMLRAQRALPHIPPRLLKPAFSLLRNGRIGNYVLGRYFSVADPDFPRGGDPVSASPPPAASPRQAAPRPADAAA